MANQNLPRFANLRDGDLVSYAQRKTPLNRAIGAFQAAAEMFSKAWGRHG